MHNIVAVETATPVVHMVYRAISLSNKKGTRTFGPFPVMIVAIHRLEGIIDPTLNVLNIYELNRWTTTPLSTEKVEG